MSYGLNSYKTSKTTTASREDLIVLLYEGAVRFLERSIQEHDSGNLPAHKESLRRGLAIISELQNTLDFQQGGEIAVQLFELYGYMLDRLTHANMTRDMDYLRDVITQLNILLEGWRGAVKIYKEQQRTAGTGPAMRPSAPPSAVGYARGM
jgi:flagellar protein FliS